MKSRWQDNDKEIYSTHKEGKPVVGEKFVRILNNKLQLYMFSVSNNLQIDKLDDKFNKDQKDITTK